MNKIEDDYVKFVNVIYKYIDSFEWSPVFTNAVISKDSNKVSNHDNPNNEIPDIISISIKINNNDNDSYYKIKKILDLNKINFTYYYKEMKSVKPEYKDLFDKILELERAEDQLFGNFEKKIQDFYEKNSIIIPCYTITKNPNSRISNNPDLYNKNMLICMSFTCHKNDILYDLLNNCKLLEQYYPLWYRLGKYIITDLP
jgi:hypothetical protein